MDLFPASARKAFKSIQFSPILIAALASAGMSPPGQEPDSGEELTTRCP